MVRFLVVLYGPTVRKTFWGERGELAVETHNRIRGSFELHSSWPLPNEAHNFWIITKEDRSTTTFPEWDKTVS
jgi:hypothetical protein